MNIAEKKPTFKQQHFASNNKVQNWKFRLKLVVRPNLYVGNSYVYCTTNFLFLFYLELDDDDDEKIQLQSSNSFVSTQYWCLYSAVKI